MTIDLDKLEQAARAVNDHSDAIGESSWYSADDDVMIFKPSPDLALIAELTPDAVLELIRQIRTLKNQANALHHVCAPLGLLAGADLTKEARPAVDELVRRLRAAEQDAKRYRYLRSPNPKFHRALDVCDDEINIVDGAALDKAIDAAQGASHD